MSLQAETFYAIRCDFPGCGELWDGYEYTYTTEPDAALAFEDGWYCGEDVHACPAHTVKVDCPEDSMVTQLDDAAYCQWCEDWGTDQHLAIMPDTFTNRLNDALSKVVHRAHGELDRIIWRLDDRHGPLGDFGSAARVTDRALTSIWERTCRTHKPDITTQELHDLRREHR